MSFYAETSLLLMNYIDMGASREIDRRRVKDFVNVLLAWFQDNRRPYPWRRKSTSNYQHVVSEVLLQRTRADVVSMFYQGFFARYPSWKALSQASQSELMGVLKPVGLWQRRSKVMVALSAVMVKRGGRFPNNRQQIDELPGVGQYVANAIELFVHGSARPLLDVNMARVLERYFGPRKLADIRYDPYLQSLAQAVVESGDPVCVNWAVLDFAALVCKKRSPLCIECVIQDDCKYFSTTKVDHSCIADAT